MRCAAAQLTILVACSGLAECSDASALSPVRAGRAKELAHKLSRRHSSEIPAEALPGGPSSGDDGEAGAGQHPADLPERSLKSPSRMRSGSFSLKTPSRAMSRKDRQKV